MNQCGECGLFKTGGTRSCAACKAPSTVCRVNSVNGCECPPVREAKKWLGRRPNLEREDEEPLVPVHHAHIVNQMRMNPSSWQCSYRNRFMRGIGAEFAGQCPLGATHRCCRCERPLCCDRHRLICPYCVNGYCPDCLPIHPCLRRISVTMPSVSQARVGSASDAGRVANTETVGGIEHKVGHIVEDPAGIARLIDVEVQSATTKSFAKILNLVIRMLARRSLSTW